MNKSTVLGLLASLGILAASILTALDDYTVFFTIDALIIVVGGTAAVTLICYPISQIMTLFGVFFRRLLGLNKQDYIGVINEVVMLSVAARRSAKAFEAAINDVEHPFVRDCANVKFWVESEVTHEELRLLIETRAETHFTRYMEDAKSFKTIAKFPPAFGLMGTTIGLIALLQGLGADAKTTIGPAMALALSTTLWGLVLSNFLFTPVAENLQKQTQEDLVTRRMIVEGMMLIAANKPPKYVEEMLKSFLLPNQRPAGTGNGGGNSAVKAA